jgi:hypothetical protein
MKELVQIVKSENKNFLVVATNEKVDSKKYSATILFSTESLDKDKIRKQLYLTSRDYPKMNAYEVSRIDFKRQSDCTNLYFLIKFHKINGKPFHNALKCLDKESKELNF